MKTIQQYENFFRCLLVLPNPTLSKSMGHVSKIQLSHGESNCLQVFRLFHWTCTLTEKQIVIKNKKHKHFECIRKTCKCTILNNSCSCISCSAIRSVLTCSLSIVYFQLTLIMRIFFTYSDYTGDKLNRAHYLVTRA